MLLIIFEGKSCGKPELGNNTQIEHINSTMFDGVVEYNCLPGFNSSDVMTRRCNESGVWDGNAPNCQCMYTKHPENSVPKE